MYQNYNDYELLNYISEKNEEANTILFKKYEPLIAAKARKILPYVSYAGIELNDIIQEGMLGLSNAIEHFKESKETLFYTYAKTCIERKMIDLIISTKRLKHRILNTSIPLEISDEEGEKSLEYLYVDESMTPENVLLSEEYKKEVYQKADEVLTPLERQVFELKIHGFDYKEIAQILDTNPKKIDNALQRIKNKLRNNLEI